EVQAGGRLVEDVGGAPVGAALELGGQLDALRLTAGEGGAALPEAHVPEADVDEGAQVPGDLPGGGEEVRGLRDRHVEDLGDGLALVVDLERLAVVPRAVAHLARDVDVRQELHLALERAVTLTGLAAPALDVEREPGQLVAAPLGPGGSREQGPDHDRVP